MGRGWRAGRKPTMGRATLGRPGDGRGPRSDRRRRCRLSRPAGPMSSLLTDVLPAVGAVLNGHGYQDRQLGPLPGRRELPALQPVRGHGGRALGRRPDRRSAYPCRRPSFGARPRRPDEVLFREYRLTGGILETQEVPGAVLEISTALHVTTTSLWRLAVAGCGRLTLDVDGVRVLDVEQPVDTDDPAVKHLRPSHHEVEVHRGERRGVGGAPGPG